MADEITDFVEAIQHLQSKGLVPTDMDSAELRQVSSAIKRQSIFSAQTTLTDYLQRLKDVVQSVIAPQQVQRESTNAEGETTTKQVTEGFNPATAREALRDELNRLGYSPKEGEEGTIKDLASDGRLNLVVKTNAQLAQGAGHFIKQNSDQDVVDENPALELVRFEDRKEPRDWPTRWRLCAAACGDVDAARVLEETGRMVALKNSPIWQALGDGEDGSTDTLGNPYPPFAFNSGMWTVEVSRPDAEDLGLIDPGEKAKPADFNLATLFENSLEAVA